MGWPQLGVGKQRARVCPPPPPLAEPQKPAPHAPAQHPPPCALPLCRPEESSAGPPLVAALYTQGPPCPPPRPCAPFSGWPLAEKQQPPEEEACPPFRGARHQRGGGVADEPPRRRAPPARHRTSCLGMGRRQWRDPGWRGYGSPTLSPPPPPPRTPCTPPPPLCKLRPCPSYSRRRDHNNCVRNFNYVQDVVWPHKTWVCRHVSQLHGAMDTFVSLCPLQPTWL